MASLNTPTFAVASYGNIQSYIEQGILSYPSYVFCKDKNTMVFVDKNLEIQEMNGFNQASMIEVDKLPTEDIKKNTFYLCNGKGYLLINSILVPVFKELTNLDGSLNDYDQLENLPVVNKYGDLSSPIVLSELSNGSYSIHGQYQVGGNLETVYLSANDITILVDSDEENKYITRIGAKDICRYTLNLSDMNVVTDKYATESWISAQGYATENFVNQAIEDLYNRIAKETLATITKLSQLENDCGYITESDIHEIGNDDISGLF